MYSRVPAKKFESVFWRFSRDRSYLIENRVDLTRGTHIVVYSRPGCGICIDAAEEFLANPRLKQVFDKYSIWVDTPDINFSKEYYLSWAPRDLDFPINALLSRNNWPERKVAGTPYFFFIKDGQVIGELLGWTGENRKKLPAILQQLGV